MAALYWIVGGRMELVRRPSGPEGVKFDVVDRGGLTRDDAEAEAGKLVSEAAEGLPIATLRSLSARR